MTFPANVADDYAYFDGNEQVTLFPYGTALHGPGVPNISARVYAVSKKDLRTAGTAAIVEITTNDRWIDLYVSTISPATDVNENDRIKREDGSIWSIMDCNLVTFESRFHCLCRKHPET